MAHSDDLLKWIPWAVLTASILGSGHCVAMCGGLVASVATSRMRWVAYQFGRLAGYLALGAVAGFIGRQVLSFSGQASWQVWASWAATILLGLGLFAAGVQTWRGKALHFPLLPKRALFWLHQKSRGNAALSGGLTAFLPCGWLHSFVLGALATRSASEGAFLLFVFWLGTLPALGLTPWLVNRLLRPLASRSPRLAAVILILAGAASIGVKMAPSWSRKVASSSQNGEVCHDE